QALDSGSDLLAMVVDDCENSVELLQHRLEFLAVLVDEAAELPADRRQVAGELIQCGALLPQRGEQLVGVTNEGHDLLAALGEHRSGLLGVGKQPPKLRVTIR